MISLLFTPRSSTPAHISLTESLLATKHQLKHSSAHACNESKLTNKHHQKYRSARFPCLAYINQLTPPLHHLRSLHTPLLHPASAIHKLSINSRSTIRPCFHSLVPPSIPRSPIHAHSPISTPPTLPQKSNTPTQPINIPSPVFSSTPLPTAPTTLPSHLRPP